MGLPRLSPEVQRQIGPLYAKHRSQRKVAAELGIGPTAVSKYLNKPVTVDVAPSEAAATEPPLEAAIAKILKDYGIAKPEPPKLAEIATVEKVSKKTVILTGWEIRVKPDEGFVDILKQMASFYDAELLLTSVCPEDVTYLPEILRQNFSLAHADLQLNNNLKFQYCPTHALRKFPLTGWRGGKPNETLIVPALGRQLITEPSNGDIPRQKMTTGSVGRLNADLVNYAHVDTEQNDFRRRWAEIENRRLAGQYVQALNFVVPSALIVDIVNDDLFFTRYVSMRQPGIVYDRGLKFMAGTGRPEPNRPLAINVGDIHAIHVDPLTLAATLDMIQKLKPRQVILNDVFDGASVNHHEKGRDADLAFFPQLEEEVRLTKQVIQQFCDTSEEVVYALSNHDLFLCKGLLDDPGMWRINRNYMPALELQLFRLKEQRDPIIKLLDLDAFQNLRFVSDSEKFYIGDVYFTHGHIGINGARPNFTRAAEVFNDYTQGHTHTPGVLHNATMAGTTSRRDLKYVKGASSWLGANVLIQPDSSQQLLPIIKDEWQRA